MNIDYQALASETFRGAAIGPVEVLINGQPLLQIKNTIQANPGLTGRQIVRRLPLTLSEWYVGAVAHSILSAPELAVQYLAFELCMQNTRDRFQSMLFSGGVTALVSSPMEMLLITQNQLQTSVVDAVRLLGRNILRGYCHTATRDILFVGGYKWLNPVVTQQIEQQTSLSEIPACLIAGVITGIVSGIFSQPFDTLSTVMKSAVTKEGLPKTGREYFATYGFKALFSGGAIRYLLRVPIAGIIFASWDRYSLS